ncbi:hypothetical protein Tco_0514885 [Tanacetum coccineum]
MDALSDKPLPHVFKKKSLIAMGVVMELHNGACFWPATREVEEDDEAEEADEGEATNEGAGGSADMYRNISQGDWQVLQARWMDQQDKHWGRLNTWVRQQEERANWMYKHTVC